MIDALPTQTAEAIEVPDRWDSCTLLKVQPNEVFDMNHLLGAYEDIEYMGQGVILLRNENVDSNLGKVLTQIKSDFPHIEIVFDDNPLKDIKRRIRRRVDGLLRSVGVLS